MRDLGFEQPTSLSDLGLTPGREAAAHISYASSDLAERVRSRVDIENLRISVSNTPVGGSPKTEVSQPFFAQTLEGFRLLNTTRNRRGEPSLDTLLRLPNANTIDILLADHGSDFDKKEGRSVFLFAHFVVTLGLLNKRGKVTFSEFEALSPEGLGRAASFPTYWEKDLTPRSVLGMIDELGRNAKRAIYEKGRMGLSSELLRTAHFFAASQELANKAFKI